MDMLLGVEGCYELWYTVAVKFGWGKERNTGLRSSQEICAGTHKDPHFQGTYRPKFVQSVELCTTTQPGQHVLFVRFSDQWSIQLPVEVRG